MIPIARMMFSGVWLLLIIIAIVALVYLANQSGRK